MSKSQSKCQICKKKINMMLRDLHICRCSNYYCRTHMHDHDCSFNYKELFIEQNRELIEIKPVKVEKI